MTKPVLSKADFVRRYQTGEFGNCSPTYDTPHDLAVNVDPMTKVHLRNRKAGGSTYYNLVAGVAWYIWTEMSQEKRLDWYCSLMAPTARTVIQGEVIDGPWGLNLTWTNVPLPMRDALARQAFYCVGLTAKHLLQRSMNDLSWQWLQYLLETYPDHVIEFSVYSLCWGTVPGHNTVFWEVRKY